MFYYEDVFKALNKAKVDYVVFGGVAAILYGVNRATMDLDIMIEMSAKNIDKVFDTFKKIGYAPKVPVTADQFKVEKNRRIWQRQKNMKVFSFVNLKEPIKMVDIFIKDYIKYDKLKKRKVKVGDIYIPVIAIDQLKRLKKIAGRPKDMADIDDLNRIERLL